MNSYVALLRGINVGGKNLIKMTDLAACFQALGFAQVRTYIQSGNVIFSTLEPDRERLVVMLEDALSRAFQYDANLVLRSCDEMQAIVAGAPQGFGSDPAAYFYDVIYLKEPLTASEAMQYIQEKPGIDREHAGDGVLYYTRLIARASQSFLTRLTSLPICQSVTIRNWKTTNRLLHLMQAEPQ